MSYNGPERASDPRASDPWEHADPSYGQIDLGYPHGYPDSPPVPTPPTPPPGGSRAVLAVLVTLLVLVLCGGGVAALYLLSNRGGPPAPRSTTDAKNTDAKSTVGPSASPSFDPATITIGQCLAISGPEDAPAIAPASCDPGNYKVLRRIDGTHDGGRCKGISRWNYFYDTTPDSNDFVLCLQKY